jgi:hypothetical protein
MPKIQKHPHLRFKVEKKTKKGLPAVPVQKQEIEDKREFRKPETQPDNISHASGAGKEGQTVEPKLKNLKPDENAPQVKEPVPWRTFPSLSAAPLPICRRSATT